MVCKRLFWIVATVASAVYTADAQSLKVDLTSRGNAVNSDMYGIFFEEINHAGDGGLYAEMVQNRGFEEHVLPLGMIYRDGYIYAPNLPSYADQKIANWKDPWDMDAKRMQGWRLDVSGGKSTCDVIVPEVPLHKNTPHAMQIKMQGKGKATLVNAGYWGMAVKKGERYDLRFYVCAEDFNGGVSAVVWDTEKDKAVAQMPVRTLSKNNGWTELTAELQASDDADKCELRLIFDNQSDVNSTVDVDYVSLFPQNTFKNRKNGLRSDIAGMLAALHPSFMRWPGGCIVEGAALDSRVRWKETLGDPMKRRGEWSLWGYRSTYGFGYHEFLQFCEDLDMDGMYVANAALSCSYRNGDYTSDPKEIDRFLQDIRDAIEYAIGDPSKNEWAAKRAEAGHPLPFPLKYVEIGNENFGPVYVRHFNYMYGKLKSEYPQITFINTMSGSDNEMKDVVKTDMVDPHWYVTPEYFLGANAIFDDMKRGDFTVYVGEYACNGGVGSGNMMAALSEAAFMLGMERNGDLVQMASYAPLLTNVNQPNWSCNLIWFDSHRVMGRASYYLQKMMAENRPDYNLPLNMNTTEPQKKNFQPGTVGVGTWATQAEYRNISVTSDGKKRTLDVNQLKGIRGSWENKDGAISQTGDETCTIAMSEGSLGSKYTIELQARKTGGKEGFFIFFGMDDTGRKGYVFNIGGWNNSSTAAQVVDNGNTGVMLNKSVTMSVETGRWYDIKVEVDKDLAVLYVDGKKISEATEYSYPDQFFGAGYDEKSGEAIIKVVNADTKPYKISVNLDGAASVAKSGKVITLSAAEATDENTLDNPEKIAPKTTKYNKFGKKFSYTFEPLSITILRMNVKQ